MPAQTHALATPKPLDGALLALPSLFDVRRNKLRWIVLGLISSMFFITFLDKAVISSTAPLIAAEFKIDKTSMGAIFSAFVIASAIGQIPAGWLTDRIGPRRTLSGCVTLWSLATLLTGLASGFFAFCAVRFLTGLFESAAFPGGTRALVPWFGRSERGFVQGAPHLFGRFATAIVPLASVSVSAAWGWRGVFYVFGVLGLVWTVGFWRLYRDCPADHPSITVSELASAADGAPSVAAERSATPWRALFQSRTSWGLIIGSAAYTYCIFFYTTWLPTYLVSHRGMSLGQMGVFASLPLLAGMAGDVCGGLLSDAIFKRTGRLGLARKAVVVPSFLLAAAALIPAAMADNAYASVGCLAASLFFMELMTGPWWAVPSDVAGAHAGTLAGIMNMAANVAGAISPFVFGVLAQNDQWTMPFVISAVILIAGAVAWIVLVDPATPIVTETADA
ncbi:MFS transporter [Acidisphaera sp. L21]|uniref:MFS transporter n=1 Tax=Acidisphaera sp. L21 TaxID=1641851 RepID=UPI00131A85FD|nr:MFS transporter [Acidisphaera sp. L21]